MGLTETILFYLMFGMGIAAAVALTSETGGLPARLFRAATAIFFWPLYLPILLDRPERANPKELAYGQAADEFAQAIAQVETELEAALDSLDGWAENVLAREQ